MKAPISWLNKYTKVTLPISELMWKLTEAGLTCESFEEIEGDKVLNIEATPNRPDWLSIIGIAREISVIENSRLELPKIPEIPKLSANLPIKVGIKHDLVGRYAGITIADVVVKDSPLWMQKSLKLVGLRPINNLVDITNYVMFELGIPIHVFDYDKFLSPTLTIELSSGGENFTSVDGVSYVLPKDSLIIKDGDRVIDLAGIKGGENTGITDSTKNIFIHVPIYNPLTIRRTSQRMKLASDASYIYERGPDLGGIPQTLRRVVDLTLNLAGGKVASKVIDTKNDSDFKPNKLSSPINTISNILGIDINIKTIISVLEKLEFSPQVKAGELTCFIPSFRADIKIKEDLIEEIARVYSYNRFPLTLPSGAAATEKIPYFYDRNYELKLKNLFQNLGFLETNTLSLISEKTILMSNLDVDNHIRIDNPVSLEYEYLRTSLIPSLLHSIKLNADETFLKFFEYNKTYLPPVDKAQEEFALSAIIKEGKYSLIKGVLDTLLDKLNITDIDIKPTASGRGLWHPVKSGVIEKKGQHIGFIGEINPQVLGNFGIQGKIQALELSVTALKNLRNESLFTPIPKHPPQIEDLTLEIPNGIKVGDVITSIYKTDKKVANVELRDIYKRSYTFRIYYQDPNKTLHDEEIEKIRRLVLKNLKKIIYKKV